MEVSSSLSSLSLLFFLCVSGVPISFAQWDVKSFIQSLTNHVFPQLGSKDQDRITSLPGQPKGVNFTQYSGYISVDSNGTRNLFYYFAEATGGADSKPLVLWLNGVPGSSSFGMGAFQQHGPFKVDSSGTTLKSNTYAWNKLANMLYLESPIQVGFSYTTNPSDFCDGDETAAVDNYRFLVNWLERFPEYKSRHFYLAGNNYAGYYVPQLADVISFYNKKQKQNVINLKGIILGNPRMDDFEDMRGRFTYLSAHGIISDELTKNVTKACSCQHCSRSWDCYLALDGARTMIVSYNMEDVYDLPCQFADFTPGSFDNDAQEMYDCRGAPTTHYLNLPQVQSALRVRAGSFEAPWVPINTNFAYNYGTRYNSTIPMLKNVMAAGIPIWVYSGDFDTRNPVTSTMYSLRLLKLTVEKQWRGWYSSPVELAGMTLTYQGNLTFITVRAAGHVIHMKQPARAFIMFRSILQGQDLPHSPYFFY